MKPKLGLNIETKVQNFKNLKLYFVIYDCKNFFS